jgi:PadR family transcriptional regulator, regulatory protein PadR
MAKGDFLGEFEHLVLLALVRLGPAAYGMPVRQEIEARTGREASIGAVYATLDRLEGKGLVRSELGEPSPERGGRAKRLFEVTAAGRSALAGTQEALRRMLEGLDDALSSAGEAS